MTTSGTVPHLAVRPSARSKARSASVRRRFVRFRSAESARILLSCVLVAFSFALGFTPSWASEINGSDIQLNVEIAPRAQCGGQCGGGGLPATGIDPMGALIAAGLCGGTGMALLLVGRERPATRQKGD
ncbi:hypothetical protein [Paenarthrobacter histidinolovorans]|uniref:Uncharacterized protein n=1 Tax=Paenarthrobacter histidinolovorans TaxID=43664 RepID=A0ABW8N9F7_9MICC